MSVENTEVVDFVGTETETGHIILTISDHLDWSDELKHIYALQEKINAYLRFIESGELIEQFPNAEGRLAVIQVMSKFCPPDTAKTAERFFNHTTEVLKQVGIQFRLTVFNPHREEEAQNFN